jgi:tryptophan synthase beta chain
MNENNNIKDTKNTPLGGMGVLKDLGVTPPLGGWGVNSKGYYGEFGGAFIPEMLQPNVDALKACYLGIINSHEFKQEFIELLKNYVGRPSPLYFAKRLSEKYGAKIYLKREDLNHTGSHKINNTIGQILLAKKMGKKRIIAETGAGQHGVATATVCALMDLECIVYMGELDVHRQEPNVKRMEMLGAKVVPALSGNKTLKDATNEALRDWINNPEDTYYLIGSVVGPHPYPDIVAKFQSVISEEIGWQLDEQIGRTSPDYLIACVGGGSNAAGTFYHYLDDEKVQLIGVEASGLGINTNETAASLACGDVGFIHGSKTMLMQDHDGQIIEPYSISAGLDYPGIGPLHANLFKTGRARYLDATDREALDAAFLLTRTEGIIPALESAHAMVALDKIKFKPDDVVIVTISGRGDKDMDTYIKYLK